MAIAWFRVKQADLAGDRLGREPGIAGHHRHLDAGVPAETDGLRHLGPWWVIQPHQPDQAQAVFQGLRWRVVECLIPRS
jgi:hypothetical protein